MAEDEQQFNLEARRLWRPSPRAVVLAAALYVGVAWTIFIAVDILHLVERPEGSPVWPHLFNDRPVEWAQWLLLGVAVLLAGYVAGLLSDPDHRRIRAFLLILGAGLVLMLFEDAGDARHVISYYVRQLGGSQILGLHYRVLSDVPYLLAVASLPIYAFFRHGAAVWRLPGTRPYLIAAFGLYAVAGGSSGVRHHADLYIRIGGAVDKWLFAGRFPISGSLSQERTQYLLIDSVLEESIETMAAACMVALLLAIATACRRPHRST